MIHIFVFNFIFSPVFCRSGSESTGLLSQEHWGRRGQGDGVLVIIAW